ncbi:hypothetical protein GYMLUDRAFT_416189 [Collybiopsis luxurians FD-317 M1]|nr:hypothetical protein GYMLUDRAFT_416189 [Collybiopsis luxurians FD-317 M1]
MLSLLFTIFTFFTTIVWSQTTSPCAQDCAQQSAAASGCTDANGKYNTQCLCTNLIAISADAGACIGANTTCSSTTPVEQIETTELEAFFKVTCNRMSSLFSG